MAVNHKDVNELVEKIYEKSNLQSLSPEEWREVIKKEIANFYKEAYEEGRMVGYDEGSMVGYEEGLMNCDE